MADTLSMEHRPAIYVVAVGLAICWCVATLMNRRRTHLKAKQLGCLPAPQRPYRWPFALDILYGLLQADKAQHVPEWLHESYKQMGGKTTWLQSDLGKMNYFTCDPKNIQAVLATQFQDFELGAIRNGTFLPLLGTGIFTSDGKAWEHSRSMLRPQFSRQQVADLHLEEEHVGHMLQHLGGGKEWTDFVDVVPLFFRLTLDSATEFLFGQSVDSQLAALSGHKQNTTTAKKLDWTSFGPAFDAATADLAFRGRLNRFYWMYRPKAFRDRCQTVHDFADYYVNLALNSPPSQEKSKYVFLQELVRQTRDPVELRSQLLNILLAGRDTTAGLLGWTFYLLAKNPSVFEKLRQAVLDSFDPEDLDSITFESLKQCNYLQQTLSESLRLFSTVPSNFRQATRDTTLPRGGGPDGTAPVFVKKGQLVGYSVHVMHHREDLWGADVEEFRPERWVGRKPGWDFLPFNGGPRICLGQQFALTEAGYVIVRLLQTFDNLEAQDLEPNPKHQYSLTTAPAKLVLRFHKAAQAKSNKSHS